MNRCNYPPPQKVALRKLPVNELVQHTLDVLCAPILIVEVIGVLPDVDGQDRDQPHCQDTARIAGSHDPEALAVIGEPRPAGAKLRGRGFLPFALERPGIAEG